MKKYLLSLVVAGMAMTANAQQIASFESLDAKSFKKFEPKALNIPVSSDLKANAKDFTAVKANFKGAAKKAPALSSLLGDYIQDDVDDIHTCYTASLSEYDYTDESGVTYNVEVSMCAGYADVLGVYQGDSIVIPCQTCYVVDKSDDYYESLGECEFLITNLILAEDGSIENIDDSNIVFDVNEDGSLSLRNDGYYLYITDGSYKGYAFVYGKGVSLFPENASQTVSNTSNQSFDAPAYVEDYENFIGVYDFAGFGAYAEMTVNDDLSVNVEPGQHMMETSSSYVSQGYSEYYDLYLYFYSEEDKTWYFSVSDPITGVLSANTITFDNGFALISTIENSDGSLGGYGYAMSGYTLTLNNGNFLADGIKEVNGTREDQIKNTKTYNLMGQQVNRDSAKGLLIYGGKKYIKK